jgi:hypothetical protein
MYAIPIEIKHANAVIAKHHRHSAPVVGAKFAIGAVKDGELAGVVIVGRPIARNLDDGYTAEVLRLCTVPDAPKNACSFLYARAWQAWRAMGGALIITYTLQSESGASLRGAGWNLAQETGGNQWNGTRTRAEREIYDAKKWRWEMGQKQIGLQHPKLYRLFEVDNLQLSLLD